MPQLRTPEMAGLLGITVRRLNQLGRDGTLARLPNYLWDRDRTLAAYKGNVNTNYHPAEKKARAAVRGTAVLGPEKKKRKVRSTPPVIPKVVSLSSGLEDSFYQAVPGSKAEAELRKILAEGRMKELQYREKCGELVAVADVQRVWGAQISSIKNSLLLLPAKVAPKLAAEKEVAAIHEVLDKEIRRVLTELSQYQPPSSQKRQEQQELAS